MKFFNSTFGKTFFFLCVLLWFAVIFIDCTQAPQKNTSEPEYIEKEFLEDDENYVETGTPQTESNDNVSSNTIQDLSAIEQRKIDEEFIRENIDVGSLCILRSGKMSIIIDKNDSIYTFYIDNNDEEGFSLFTVSHEEAVQIVKRFVDLDLIKSQEYIKNNLQVGRDCQLRVTGVVWVLIISINDDYIKLLHQDTGKIIQVRKENVYKIFKNIREIGLKE